VRVNPGAVLALPSSASSHHSPTHTRGAIAANRFSSAGSSQQDVPRTNLFTTSQHSSRPPPAAPPAAAAAAVAVTSPLNHDSSRVTAAHPPSHQRHSHPHPTPSAAHTWPPPLPVTPSCTHSSSSNMALAHLPRGWTRSTICLAGAVVGRVKVCRWSRRGRKDCRAVAGRRSDD